MLADVAGTELIAAQTNTIAHIDRPVTVNAQPVAVKTKNSLLMLAASKTQRLLYLYDDNIEADNAGNVIAYFPKPISFALNNAVFKTSQPKGCLLFGSIAENFINVENAYLILTFGLYAYLPILPDPYVANLGVLKRQFLSGRDVASVSKTYSSAAFQQEWLLLVCTIQWKQKNKESYKIDVAFSFAPLPQQQTVYSALSFNKINVGLNQTQSPVQNNTFINEFNVSKAAISSSTNNNISSQNTNAETAQKATLYSKSVQGRLPDYQSDWDERYSVFQNDMFALLDVSSNANQLGVSFQVSFFRDRSTRESNEYLMYKTYDVASANQSGFPLQVEGMNVISENRNVKAFLLPQVSWEPVKNLTAPEKSGDPALSYNYYPNDGGATRIFNNSVQLVPIAPIPVAKSLINTYQIEENNKLGAIFTLPFGIRAISILDKKIQTPSPLIDTNAPVFDSKYFGGIQLKLTGGNSGNTDVSDQFRGATVQVNNILNLTGGETGNSTLGFDVTKIFNGEFYEADETSVPVTRFDLSGYGASIFSNWHNKGAEFATTSQAEFEIFVGRTAHEVVQVKSVLYPWGIHVVRTITLFRAASGYEYRYDSGWKAEGDGKFDFSFSVVTDDTTDPVTKHKVVPYEIHPGTIEGLFNVKNIKSAVKDIAPFTDSMDITSFYEFNAFNKFIYPYTSATSPVDVDLEPVYFDADIEIENTIQGQLNGRVPAKKILGFVQVAPTGLPLTPISFQKLLRRQDDSIGGPLDCIIDIGLNGQQMRLNRIDVNNSKDASGANPVFVVAARGNVILPKEGSWSMVKHIAETGEVVPLPQGVTVPLIRIGKIDENLNFPVDDLLRIANPTELLKLPDDDTINFGYLQSTNTQKALFLTPAYQKLADATQVGKLLSKTPPLFADAYRIMNSKGIFPNIGDAVNNFGDIIPLAENFAKNTITDAGKQVLELMQVNLKDAEGKVLQQGYKLLKQIETFDLPDSDWPLIDITGLKIYVQYKAAVRNGNAVPKKGNGSPDYNNASNFNNTAGLLNFDVDSFASNVADNWKSKLNNISMVIDLGPFKSLATIKGNFNSQNGSEASYEGDSSNPDFQAPQLSFGPDLDVVMDILQVLVDLQTGDYSDAVKKGLKIAMSNSADSWSYKFDASKEIPIVKFPTPDIVYDDPNTPLKLECSLKFGVYFNETLKVTTDPSQLLPTAGAYIDFYGKLSVTCVSLSVATVYAVGSVDLKIAADTGIGPSLNMKFGFGAQIVIGLPVVGNVSILYMMGIQIYLDSNTTTVTASLLYQGHADLLGGLVEITITIEAQGGISRSNDQTICEAQVTFAIDISIFLVIDIDFSKSWSEQRQIA